MRQKTVRKVLLVFITAVISLLTAGCWDARELQDRSFVLAAAIDTVDAGTKPGKGDSTSNAETFIQLNGSKKYRLSLQVYKLAGGGGGGEGESGGGGKKEPSKTYVISNTGQSIFEMVRDMLGQSSKGLFWEHVQCIIISEAAVKEAGLGPILDFFRRDPEMRWRIRVMITPGEARKLIEFQPPSGEPGAIYLNGLLRNHPRNLHVPAARTDLGYISQYLDTKQVVIIPVIVKSGDVVKAGGAAVFKKDKFAGYLDEKEVEGMKFIYGSEKSGIITLECKDHPGQLVAFELFTHDTRLKAHADGDNIYFVLDIMMRGNLGEVTCSMEHDTTDEKYLREAEVAFAEEVKRVVFYSHQKSQRLNVDFLHLGAVLKKDEPKAWERVKDRWDEIYPTVPLIVSVNVSIRNVGEHK